MSNLTTLDLVYLQHRFTRRATMSRDIPCFHSSRLMLPYLGQRKIPAAKPLFEF